MTVNRNSNLIPRKSYPTLSPGYIRNLLNKGGLKEEIAAPLTTALNTIFNKFATDERLNYDVIEKFMQQPGGDGQRTATVVVAAHNTHDAGKAAADFVCTGTDDHLVIDEALESLGDSSGMSDGTGGLCLLLEGEFECEDGAAAGVFTYPQFGSTRGITLAGLGYGSLIKNGTFDTDAPVGLTIRNLGWYRDIGASNLDAILLSMGGSDVTIRDCAFYGMDISLGSDTAGYHDYEISRCLFDASALNLDWDAIGPSSAGAHHLVVANNRGGNMSISKINNSVIVGNANLAGLDLDWLWRTSITGNSGDDGADLTLDDSEDCALAGNVFDTYTETSCTNIVKAGNVGTGF